MRAPWARALGRFVAVGTAALAWTNAAAAKTVYFPHEDDRYLQNGDSRGGAAFIPKGVQGDRAVPLAVMLHGTNPASVRHVWMGGGGKDLRPVVERLVTKGETVPFVLAAPSKTRSAMVARTLWEGFDLEKFLLDLRRGLGGHLRIDESQVVLLGHSAAGCNPSGGLASNFRHEGALRPAAIVVIDPCLDAEMGRAFLRGSLEVPLLLYWQQQVWPRSLESWLRPLSERSSKPLLHPLNIDALDPHDAVVPVAFAHAMRELLPAPRGRGSASVDRVRPLSRSRRSAPR